MQQHQLKGSLMLFFCALIWGLAFVAQSVGADHVGAFTFNGIRSLIGAAFLIPCAAFFDRLAGKPFSIWGTDNKTERQDLITGGIVCGIVLTIASTLQQIGIGYTSVGKAGFITTLYIVIVPLFGLIVHKTVTRLQWLSVLIAAAGMYFICINENFSVNYGDIIIFACACFFALHIITIERFSVLVDGVRMSLLQFAVCGILSLPAIFFYETPTWEALEPAWLPILYAGVMSCGIAYTLQILGQKYVNVILASIILSMESVFSVLAGWLLLGQQLSLRELGGCGLVFVAILLAQLPPKRQ